MAAILALQGCYCHNRESTDQKRIPDNLSFSRSISVHKFLNFKGPTWNRLRTDKFFKFQVEMRRTDSPSKLLTNGRAVKMVPASKVLKRKPPSNNKVDTVHGSKQVVNGANIVRKQPTAALVKTPIVRGSKELPPTEELKVLPSDEGFSWANENYNSLQRTIDVWSFVIAFRVRVLLDNEKWAYLGGFANDKQVRFLELYCGSYWFLLC